MTQRISATYGNHRGLIIPGFVLLLILATLPATRAGRIFARLPAAQHFRPARPRPHQRLFICCHNLIFATSPDPGVRSPDSEVRSPEHSPQTVAQRRRKEETGRTSCDDAGLVFRLSSFVSCSCSSYTSSGIVCRKST
ncbi:GM12782 [Drosophila sechellia]|uniref:GM12782 n=1 Tax=Drosophila sechellia TaxID=7238 RepID=B4HZ92_DROSE|nr:GM12782 [Drosophila sechellia]